MIEEINRIVRKKENAFKTWEEHCMKSLVAHEKEKQGLKSHLTGRKTYLGTVYDTGRRHCLYDTGRRHCLLTNSYSFDKARNIK